MDSSISRTVQTDRPPTLPVRMYGDSTDHCTESPPSYASIASTDLRSSTPNLVSSENLTRTTRVLSGSTTHRKLLLVYIHGFLGSESTFRSFPAHVHNLVTTLLADTHIVQTKIYPRYQSRDALRVSRDALASWLAPHSKDPSTDVVLLAHSMGGLFAADFALLPPPSHPPLGILNFDVPFLGMHPRVIGSGLSSLFSPTREPKDQWGTGELETGSGTTDTLRDIAPQDPNFNPAFANDIRLPSRNGWSSALSFLLSNKDDIWRASKDLVSSHLIFGGAMANYRELSTRYSQIRVLEEADERTRKALRPDAPTPRRVRFVNYYTACTGRPKTPCELAPEACNVRQSHEEQSPQPSLVDGNDFSAAAEALTVGAPAVSGSETPLDVRSTSSIEETYCKLHTLNFPPVPAPPVEPTPPDLSELHDAAARKILEKEHARAVKVYKRAVKDREKSIKDRDKYLKKVEKKVQKHAETPAQHAGQVKKELSGSMSEMNELTEQNLLNQLEELRSHQGVQDPALVSTNSSFSDPGQRSGSIGVGAFESVRSRTPIDRAAIRTTPKDRTFCSLPPKDSGGVRDPCWVRVFLKDMGEVEAHCGLFFVDERYERLVGDVAQRVEQWVREDGR